MKETMMGEKNRKMDKLVNRHVERYNHKDIQRVRKINTNMVEQKDKTYRQIYRHTDKQKD